MSRRLVLALVLACSGCWCPAIGLAERGELGQGATLAVVNSSSFPIERIEFVLGNALFNCRSDDQLQGTPIPPGGLRCFELAPGERRVWVVSGSGRWAEAWLDVPVGGRVTWAYGRHVTADELRGRRSGGAYWHPAFVLTDDAGHEQELADLVLPTSLDEVMRLDRVRSEPPTFRVTRRNGGTEEVLLAPGTRAVGHVLPDGQEVSVPVGRVACDRTRAASRASLTSPDVIGRGTDDRRSENRNPVDSPR